MKEHTGTLNRVITSNKVSEEELIKPHQRCDLRPPRTSLQGINMLRGSFSLIRLPYTLGTACHYPQTRAAVCEVFESVPEMGF